MEQLDYNLLFRWFVGLEIDEPVWNHAVFNKNRDRLLNQEVAQSSRFRPENGVTAQNVARSTRSLSRTALSYG